MRRDFSSASPLLVFQVIIDGRYDAHRLYIGRIGVPVGDRELSLVGKFDLSQFAFRIVREFFAGDAAFSVASSIIFGLISFNAVEVYRNCVVKR